MRHTVVIERTPNNHAADVPDLPGCIATANTGKHTLTRRFAPPSPTGRGSDCRTDEPKRCAARRCAPGEGVRTDDGELTKIIAESADD